MSEQPKKQSLYQQVAIDIEKRIGNGEFPKGSMIISEAQVQKEYDVSRVTVRKAYKSLVDRGILRTVQGKGTFVNDVDTRDWTWMRSFSRQVKESGRVPTTRIISFKTKSADDILSERLNVKPGCPCYYLKRVRYIDNQPMWLTKSFFACTLAPELTADHFSIAGVTQSIFKVLELNFGVCFSGGEELQEAINITEKDAGYLQIESNKPVVSSAFIAYDTSGEPLLYENTVFRQNHSSFGGRDFMSTDAGTFR